MIFFFADKPDVKLPAIAKCMDYLRKKCDFIPGKTEELGDGIRCIISSYETVEESQAFWEAHKSLVDVHCIIQGTERVSVCALAQAQAGQYHAERDYLETVGVPAVDLCVMPGTVLCLFPNDVHRTKVNACVGKSERILKAIFKVPLDLMD